MSEMPEIPWKEELVVSEDGRLMYVMNEAGQGGGRSVTIVLGDKPFDPTTVLLATTSSKSLPYIVRQIELSVPTNDDAVSLGRMLMASDAVIPPRSYEVVRCHGPEPHQQEPWHDE